jgi:hypothetical protein
MKAWIGIWGVLCATALEAKVSAVEAARLKSELTDVGAQRAGNEDGSIPAWEGGITKVPAGYHPAKHHVDPFPGDKVLYTVDQSNVDNYRELLSPGQLAMIAKYKSYKLQVYPTRRSASFPARVYQMTFENATRTSLLGHGSGVVDAAEGFPFPIPADAYEVIWNHKLKFKGVAARRHANQVTPTAGGEFTPIMVVEQILGLYWKEGATLKDTNNVLAYYYQEVTAPPRLAGQMLLVHETLDQIAQPRQAWTYNPGQRRVRKTPNVAYDNPGQAADALRTNDMTDMFNGALDRFDWKLVGKREMLIPYNCYKVHESGLTFEQIVRPGHINPDLMRYERHRVWVVEATLKKGLRHINARRTFYLDEDSWQIVLTDHYDAGGKLWRASEAALVNYYQVPLLWTTLEAHYDLRSGRYIASGLDNLDAPVDFAAPLTPENFTPQALRVRGVR